MIVFFVFKQKTAYEMRISDWSSDVCSSDLIKLDSDRPVARIEAIRKCRPDARLTVDANQGWSFAQLKEIAAAMQKLGVLFIEQPLPRGSDERLESYWSPLPLFADESCLHLGALVPPSRRYQTIGISHFCTPFPFALLVFLFLLLYFFFFS